MICLPDKKRGYIMEQAEKKLKSAFEKFLSTFSEVKSGEGALALLMTLNIFLILTAYLIAKVVREPLILAGGGAEVKSYSAALQAVVLVFFLKVYAWMVTKFPRRQLINSVTLFFTGCFILFYFLAVAGFPIGVVYYIWVGIFSLMVVAQFWSFANDIYTPEEGNRLFVIIQFGASAGGVFGPLIASRLIEPLGLNQLLILAAVILVLSLLINNYVDTKTRKNAKQVAAQKAMEQKEEPISKKGAFKVVFQSKYLLMIAFIVLFTNWVNTTGEYILGKSVVEAAHAASSDESFIENYIGTFYGNFFTIVGAAGLILQLFFVSRIIKYWGIRVAIMILPIVAMGGYFLIALFPILKIISWRKIAENSVDYSLNSTVRNILFLPTTREEKYKAKVTIDSFFQRAGDVLSALIVFFGVTYFSFGITQFAIFNICLVAVWLVLAFKIGKENQRLVAEKEAKEA
jgi:AAA family ATP:ADP antiporter